MRRNANGGVGVFCKTICWKLINSLHESCDLESFSACNPGIQPVHADQALVLQLAIQSRAVSGRLFAQDDQSI